jgi:hypothetical protein
MIVSIGRGSHAEVTLDATSANSALIVSADGGLVSLDCQPSSDRVTFRSPLGGLRGFVPGVEQRLKLELSDKDRVIRVTLQNDAHESASVTLSLV